MHGKPDADPLEGRGGGDHLREPLPRPGVVVVVGLVDGSLCLVGFPSVSFCLGDSARQSGGQPASGGASLLALGRGHGPRVDIADLYGSTVLYARFAKCVCHGVHSLYLSRGFVASVVVLAGGEGRAVSATSLPYVSVCRGGEGDWLSLAGILRQLDQCPRHNQRGEHCERQDENPVPPGVASND